MPDEDIRCPLCGSGMWDLNHTDTGGSVIDLYIDCRGCVTQYVVPCYPEPADAEVVITEEAEDDTE